MDDKIFLKKMQNDLIKSNPIIINNNDNLSIIQKNMGSKYTEDISDSDDDLSSYKNRNLKMINQVSTKNNKVKKTNVKKNTNNIIDDKFTNNSLNSTKSNEIKEINENNENNENNSNNEFDELADPNIQYEFTKELEEKVKNFVKNDDKIRELQIELKKLNTAKKVAETEILKHLERLGESNINITGGKLRINQYESKESLKEDIIKEAIGEKIKDPKIIENIFEKINEKRIANGKVQKSLKRTFERDGNGKKK